MSLVFTDTLDILTTGALAARSTTYLGSAWAAPKPHDQLLLEVGPYTQNSGSGTVTPTVFFSPTLDGTYSELFSGDPLAATNAAPVRYHMTDVTFVLTGFYKLGLTVTGTVDFDGSLTLYTARRTKA